MHFNFVLVAFCSVGDPPHGHTLKVGGKTYQFAPLVGNGSIFTVDIELWPRQAGGTDVRERCFCPPRDAIIEMFSLGMRESQYCVVALTSECLFIPPGSPDVRLPLVSWTSLDEKLATNKFVDMGFDVIDQWTGISALANLGYDSKELLSLQDLQLETNEFGMLRSAEDASIFASFASKVAHEHAPFTPVKSLVWLPTDR